MISNYELISFWAGIMKDHSQFIISSLSYKENETINHAKFFNEQFSFIENQSDNQISKEFIKQVNTLLLNFIDFKKYIITCLMKCNIELRLPPSFINHMINEAEEFFRDLQKISNSTTLQSENNVKSNLWLHKIWLPDASGHAAAIAGDLDPVETELINEAKMFQQVFDDLFIKAFELYFIYERTGLKNGILENFNLDVKDKIVEFISFLEKIRQLVKDCKVMNVLIPLMPDHMIREEYYYLTNIKIFLERSPRPVV